VTLAIAWRPPNRWSDGEPEARVWDFRRAVGGEGRRSLARLLPDKECGPVA